MESLEKSYLLSGRPTERGVVVKGLATKKTTKNPTIHCFTIFEIFRNLLPNLWTLNAIFMNCYLGWTELSPLPPGAIIGGNERTKKALILLYNSFPAKLFLYTPYCSLNGRDVAKKTLSKQKRNQQLVFEKKLLLIYFYNIWIECIKFFNQNFKK